MIGGGAAGAALALFLARRDVSVTLVDDGRAHYSGPFETVLGVPPSTETLRTVPSARAAQ